MAQAAENKVMDALEGIRKDIGSLMKEVHEMKEFLEDTHLTEEERKDVDDVLSKIKSEDRSDFLSSKEVKKKLGI